MLKAANSWLRRGSRSPKPEEEVPREDQTAALEARIRGRKVVDHILPVSSEASTETRAAERFVPRWTTTSLTTMKGKKMDARIINLSRVSVAVEADFSKLNPEDVAMVGARPVKQGRRITRGMVFLFEKPIDPRACGPDLIL